VKGELQENHLALKQLVSNGKREYKTCKRKGKNKKM